MSAFKRLVIEALVKKNHLSLINPILGNVKAHFSGLCTVMESSKIDELLSGEIFRGEGADRELA
jgi:hypothetical protein